MTPFSNLLSPLTRRFLGAQRDKRFAARAAHHRSRLAIAARDDLSDRPWNATGGEQDRHARTRAEILYDALQLWRDNPLARRIVALTSQYVVGGGLSISSPDESTNAFLQEWWNHRLNRMTIRAFEWCDELTRAGELFVVLSTDAGGMSYVRAIPASEIEDIECASNDLDQPLAFLQKAPGGAFESVRWQAYRQDDDMSSAEDGTFPTVMLHYPINRPVGAKFGESDLAPLLKWCARHGEWLEDRVRLNRYRNTFVFWVKRSFRDEAERLARQNEIHANPPRAGSILVTDQDEDWSILHPQLGSHEAAEDGLAIKKFIAAGAGVPLHFLAEPESSTRTTAEQAGGPTFRHFEQRQIFFLWMLSDLARIVVRRAALAQRRGVQRDASLQARGTDIFARDNAGLAASAVAIIEGFSILRDRNLIDDAEFLRLAYKFAGEVADVAELLARGKQAPRVEPSAAPSRKPKADTAARVPPAQDIARRDM
jgi:hypothetical protein